MTQSDGSYRIVEQLGIGLTGAVFAAETPTGRVALRQFQPDDLPGSADHFVQAARTAATLKHARIVSVQEVIDEAGEAYVAMEYVPTETLARVLDRGERFTQEKANYLLRLLAVALDYAHEKGIAHGDLKPSNIFILPGGQAKISDFAISPRGWSNHGAQLPDHWIHPYLSPEHLSAPELIGPRSDQYSLAVIAFQLYTGELPFANVDRGLGASILGGVMRPPSSVKPGISPSTDNVLLKALSRNPLQRYSSCLELVDELDASVAPREPVKLAAPSRRRPLYAGIAILAAAIAIIALLWPSRPVVKAVPVVAPAVPATEKAAATEKPKPFPPKAQTPVKNNAQAPVTETIRQPPVVVVSPPVRPTYPDPATYGGAPPRVPDTAASLPPSKAEPVPLPIAPLDEQGIEIRIYSRSKVIEPGTVFSAKDAELGEMAAGDLKVVVSGRGATPKRRLSIEWLLDAVRMDLKPVTIRTNGGQGESSVEYGNEPTPGNYRIILRAGNKILKEVSFRISQ